MNNLNIMKLLLVVFLIIMLPRDTICDVLFEDDFDKLIDWSPDQQELAIGCSLNCDSASNILPNKYHAYRVQGTVFKGDPGRNTLNISSENFRGSSGKCLTYWSESSGGTSTWGSDGLLAVLLDRDQNELYVRFYIKFQADWKWSLNNSPMQKIFRISHYEGDDSNPFIFGGSNGTQKPLIICDLVKWNGGLSDIGYSPSFRYENIYYPSEAIPSRDSADTQYFPPDGNYGGTGVDFSDSGMMGDGNWHCWEFYVKLNSNVGVADGIHKFWQDGILIYETHDLSWADEGAQISPRKGWNYVMLGGNNINQYNDISERSEQWHAIDDFVISTKYIGPDNCKPHDVRISQ